MTTATKEAAEQAQYLTFLLANEEYAIGILKVREIIEYDTVTTVPKTPKWIRGVINLRGIVVPVVDMRIKFGMEDCPVTRTTCILIVEGDWDGQATLMGVIADAVSQVMDISPESVQEVPSFGTRVKVDYLQGMAQLGKKFVLLLDIDKVLSADEALDLTEAAIAGAAEIEAPLPELAEAVQEPGESAPAE